MRMWPLQFETLAETVLFCLRMFFGGKPWHELSAMAPEPESSVMSETEGCCMGQGILNMCGATRAYEKIWPITLQQ